MSLESDLFGYLRPDVKKLKQYGFTKEKKQYRYACALPVDSFAAEITVDEKGEVSGRVMDRELDEEFVQVHLPGDHGSFVAAVKEAYLGELEKIAEACFHPVRFRSSQANRLADALEKKYRVKADYPWAKYPGFAVFRIRENEKWFALIMNIDRSRLETGEGEVNVLNLRVPAGEAEAYTARDGIFPAYHSNKKNWISVILDDRLKDEEIEQLIAASHDLVEGVKKGSLSGHWIIPANPKYYDIIAAFERNDVITWHQSTAMKPGDIVYIYYAAPYSCILYACVVVASDLPNRYSWNPRYKKMISMQRIRTFERGLFPIEWMRQHGVAYVRSTRSCPQSLVDAIEGVLAE